VRRTTSADLWIQVTAATTIRDIKRKIFEDGAIAPAQQRLTFGSNVLSRDEETLEQAVRGFV